MKCWLLLLFLLSACEIDPIPPMQESAFRVKAERCWEIRDTGIGWSYTPICEWSPDANTVCYFRAYTGNISCVRKTP